ncbi:cation:proton antiporter [Bacteroidetes bacterium endosymbiont of Geopemphigus sp.]|uniref:cation:proton antiporter n=1 Tax=Bacteroidetes bacterium endosymbiont of Geopemphigus sp. TaxID=2047937 RepID=UPI000CD092CB|nr:cation:proton antiporter [Bacteroidetes bacterium endosymbiont of Geopemphigus sp.]
MAASKWRFISYHINEFFDHSTCIQVLGVWDTLIFLLNGLIFILIGLELAFHYKRVKEPFHNSSLGYGLLISLVIIFIRILYVFSIILLTRRLSDKIRSTEPNLSAGAGLYIVGWAGMCRVSVFRYRFICSFCIKR